MRKIYNILCGLLILLLLIFGCISLFDKDVAASELEQRELKSFPKVTVSGILSGSFAQELDAYFADTFPGREKLLEQDGIVSVFFDFGDLELETEE